MELHKKEEPYYQFSTVFYNIEHTVLKFYEACGFQLLLQYCISFK